ncbi:UNVERIFIED_CONTAM: hypothetical protein PYX00_011945 [Menopon gallinae]|uniref:Small ribosomal subunit protein bS6m n=1 Tax=Menopon gallinae TaxID=328185 RepID=A0AAW2H926_9NEOP
MLLLRHETEMHQKALEGIRLKISESGGAVDKELAVGTQTLAYPVARQKKGYYHLLSAHLATQKIKDLNAELRLVDGLLRFLLIFKESCKMSEEQQNPIETTTEGQSATGERSYNKRGGFNRFYKKKVCKFCVAKSKPDYKEAEFLKKFITEKGLAGAYTKHNLEILKQKQKNIARRKATRLAQAQELKEKLEASSLSFSLKVGQEGRVFGSISNADIASALANLGMQVERRSIDVLAIAGRLDKAPLFIEDTPNIKLFDLRAQARRMKLLNDVKIIFIDYIGLISLDNPNMPKFEQISEISRQTEGTKPSLADIRGSGSIEQDADVVMFLYRDRKEQVEIANQDNEEVPAYRKPLEIEVIIAKQRNGGLGEIKMHFHPHHMLFSEIETVSKP